MTPNRSAHARVHPRRRARRAAAGAAPSDLDAPELYINRELSLGRLRRPRPAARRGPDQPLLERCKFAAIFGSNLDEFFMIRVAGLHDQVDAGITAPKLDGRTPSETHRRDPREGPGARRPPVPRARARPAPALAEHGIRLVSIDEVSTDARRALDHRFRRQIFPVLTPLAVGLGRPFPYISNLSLSLAVLVRDPVSRPHDVRARQGPEGDARRASSRWRTSRRRSSRWRS